MTAAVASYRACLAEPNLDADLRLKARHNLELAQMRWLKARASPQNPGNKEEPKEAKYPPEPKDPHKPDDSQYAPIKPKDKPEMQPGEEPPAATQSDQLRASGVQSLPDGEKVEPIPRADTMATLNAHARRIAEERRRQRNPVGPAAISSKDW